MTGLAPDDRPGILVGRLYDGDGLVEEVYGPYEREEARRLAAVLTSENWREARWVVHPVAMLP